MSLATWKAEFYPKPADSKEAEAAPVAHSLRKWEGLKPNNLAKHDVRVSDRGVYDNNLRGFRVASDSCALCVKFLRGSDCGVCPLYEVRGNISCDNERPRESIDPFQAWWGYGDPSRMIYWLKRAAKIHA